ncbi:MAG TPA: S9 family peptidase [Pseudonocardiaceae bacterium]|nr:S9 family peptidase [Pseudonocardiaceae bacterium]
MAIGPDDLTALSLAGSPSLAPDGGSAVVAVQTVDLVEQEYRRQLWTCQPDASPEPLTPAGGWSDSVPTHSPDGSRIALLSTRDGRRQVHVADPDTGAVRALPVPEGKAVAVAWLDDHRLVATVEHAPELDPGAPVIVEWLRYKRDGSPNFVEPTHELWLLDLAEPATRLAELSGRFAGLVTVRGRVVYALEERHSDRPYPGTDFRSLDPATGADELLWRCPAMVAGFTATDLSGDLIVVSSMAAGHSSVPPKLWLVRDGEAVPVFPDADLDCDRAILGDSRLLGRHAVIQPVSGSDDVVFVATVGEEAALFTGAPTGAGAPVRITPEGCSVTDFSPAHHGQVAACLESPTRPVEVHLVGLAPGTPKRISDLNDDWTGQAAPVDAERITVAGGDGTELHAMLYRSAGAAAGPLVLRVHGGPHLAWGAAFDVENQSLVSAGYRVLQPNPRGSAGRGAVFRAGTVGDWGGTDHADLMAFADWAVATGVADPDRLYLTGGSYGGFLTNWTLTRTQRFRAAVSERSISNFLSKLGTSDNGFTVNRFELGGADVFDDGAAALLDLSPLRHASAITTPLLLIHGEEDYRCPIEQSEQLFVALRRLGVPARFARFPGESHNLATAGRPDHRITRLRMIIAWLGEHGEPDQRASRSASQASASG